MPTQKSRWTKCAVSLQGTTEEVPVTENLNEASSGNNNSIGRISLLNYPQNLMKRLASTPRKFLLVLCIRRSGRTTDTCTGPVKGGAPNQHSSFKVKLKG